MVLTDETRLHEFVSIVPMWRWELFICLYFLARDTRRIDYRCDDRRFWLSAHDCQVPTPTSQNLDLEHQIRIFEAAQLINCLEYLNAQFLICRSIYQKKGVFWEVGVGDWQSMQDSFFFWVCWLERVNDRHFWNPGVFSYAMIPRCHPNSRVHFSSSHL
jgi:hypothetical protein